MVWPAIEKRAKRLIENSAAKIVIVDAAILLEAGWDSFVDQVWTTFIPEEEAIRRVCERNKLSEEEVRSSPCL